MSQRYLLDTHALLWALGSPRSLSPRARELIAAPGNIVLASVASMWECAIKSSLGKLEIPEDFFSLIPDAGYEVLAITIPHLEGFRALPIHHRDPFDRMLIAQAQVDGAVLMTRDAEITKYDVKTIAC